MSDMREKLADIIHTGTTDALEDYGISRDTLIGDPEIYTADLATADAIIAALPDMVEPIVWVRHPLGWNCDGFMIDARNRNAIYVMRGLYGKPRFDTVEDAKAACQAHHTAAILSAFGVQGGEA
jgi:hypothetical protein